MRHVSLAFLCSMLSLAAAARAGDVATPPSWPIAARIRPQFEPISDAARRLARQLTADDFRTRELASAELAAKSAAAFPGLDQLVAQSDDPELHARTADRVRLIPIPANTPARTAAMVREYESRREEIISVKDRYGIGDAFLPYDRQGDARALFLQIALAHERDPVLRKLLEHLAQTRVCVEARILMLEGKWDRAQEMLRQAFPYCRTYPYGPVFADYAALVAMRKGAALDPQAEVAALPPEDPALRDDVEFLLAKAKGDAARVAEIAKRPLGPSDADFFTRLEVGNYQALIQDGEAHLELRRTNTNPNAGYGFPPYLARAYRLAGNSAAADAFIEAAFKDFRVESIADQLDVFIIGDRMDLALAAARRLKYNGREPFQLLCRQLRIRDALAAIGDIKIIEMDFPHQLNDLGLHPAALKMLDDFRGDVKAPVKESGRLNFAYAAELERAGKAAEAAAWRRALMEFRDPRMKRAEEIKARSAELSEQHRQLTGKPMGSGGQTDDPKVLALRQEESALTLEMSQLSIGIVRIDVELDGSLKTPQARAEAAMWFNSALQREEISSVARYDKALRIVNGAITDAEARGLLADLEPASADAWDFPQLAIAGFHRLGRDDLAASAVERRVAKENDPSYWSWLGDIALEGRRWQAAADYYRRAAVMNITDATLMYRMGLALTHVPDSQDEGRKMLAYVPLLVLGDSTIAQSVAECMRQFEGQDVGDRWFDDYTNRYASANLAYFDKAGRRRDAALARGDLTEALQWQERALAVNRLRNSYPMMMQSMAEYHRLRVTKGLKDRDFGAVADGLIHGMDFSPPDVQLLEQAIPALKSADATAAARVLAKALDRLQPVVADYPTVDKYREELRRVEALR
jgi:tetratricopeptide (TPR) repeat protein